MGKGYEFKEAVCGGTDTSYDESAPKEIKSDKMTFFSVTSALDSSGARFGFISAFAAPAGDGTFLFLETGRRGDSTVAWALVRSDVFPPLAALVKEHGLAKQNGVHMTTHGLPENFGGSVDIRYESGEKISFSDNQSPIFSSKFASAVADVMKKAMAGERVPLPDVRTLVSIRFEETRSGGGFTDATLTIGADGAGTNEKKSRYSDPKVYESSKPVDKATVDEIKKNILDTGLLAWEKLPKSDYAYGANKKLTFTFVNGASITVPSDRRLPSRISDGFFAIELEMTTKH